MSKTLYDDLRDIFVEMSISSSHQEADECLVDLVDKLASYLEMSFPKMYELCDQVIGEWRKRP